MSSLTNTLQSPKSAAFQQRLQAIYGRYGARLPAICAFLLALLIAYQLAKLFWAIVPMPASMQWRPTPVMASVEAANAPVDSGAIAATHLFGEYQATAAATPANANGPAPETTLNFTLLGILAGTKKSESMALIAKAENDEAPYKIGEDVVPGVNLEAIFVDRVILNHNGQLETLRLNKDPNAANPNDPNAGANAGGEGEDGIEGGSAPATNLGQMREQILQDPANASRYLRIQPVTDGDSLRGYRVNPGADAGVFNSSGLKAGDVVTAINGTPISNPGQAMEVLQSLINASRVSLSIERNGSPQAVTLSLNK